MATAEGTRRLLTRAMGSGALHQANVRLLGPSGLSCAALGFGGYRIGGGPAQRTHALALRSALLAGINLVDTSAHYAATSDGPRAGHGLSEALIGHTVAELIDSGEICRDEVVLCTKLGHVARGDVAPPESVSISPHGSHGGDDWHSVHPSFVQAEVRASYDRLGFAPDFVLLHNPEYFLSQRLRQRAPIADAWDEMYDRLERAFGALEALCEEGKIASGYGVSANFLSCQVSTTGKPNLYEALQLERVIGAAEAAAGGTGKHRLQLVQMPLNLLEGGAVLGRGGAVPEAADGDVATARRLGVGVIVNRPMNAIPIPGMASGDWGRSGANHVRLRDAKPMGTVEALLKRVLLEELGFEASTSLQQAELRLVSSAQVASCLCGMRAESYVEDAVHVLKQTPLDDALVQAAFRKARQAVEELGGQTRGLW